MSRRKPRTSGRRVVGPLIVLAAALAASIAWITLFLVERSLESRIAVETTRRLDAVDRVVDRKGRRLEEQLLVLDEELRGPRSRELRTLIGGAASGRAEVGQRLLSRARLDMLEILDAEGRVLCSVNWPERVGVPATEWSALPEDRALIEEVVPPLGDGPMIIVRHSVPLGSRRVVLIAGRALDAVLLEEIAAGESAWIDMRGSVVDSAGPGALEPSRLMNAMGPGPIEVGRFTLPDGSSWFAGARELDGPDGRPIVRVVVAAGTASLRPLLDTLRVSLSLAGLAAVVLAGLAGLWIARRSSRPVDELVRAVESIGAGLSDYTFSRPVEDEFSELVSAFSRLHRDLDRQRDRTRAAERVAAWREIARHVAHEVKNPLAPIRLTVQNLVRARDSAPEQFDELFEEGTRTILEEVERLRGLVSEFSDFARLPAPQPVPVDLSELLDEVLALWSAESDLRIERQDALADPVVALDRDQFTRALHNLIGNAAHAAREATGDGRQATVVVRTDLEDSWVRVQVLDNGSGFSEEALAHLFQPYFTTKAEGTGLGLAISYRTTIEHGGVISADNRPEGGARVTILLRQGDEGVR